MKTLWLVIRRELVERKMIMLGALAIGLVIFLVPLAAPNIPTRDAWDASGLVASWILSYGVALLMGASILGRDIAERRASFYLSRPISGTTLWAGKMLAAWLLALLCGFLALVPTTLVGSGVMALTSSPGGSEALSTVLLYIVLGTLVLVPFGHVAGIALRTRSAWLLFDLIALAAFALLFRVAAEPYISTMAMGFVTHWAEILSVLLIGVLIAAGLYGFLRGRYEMSLVHAFQSVVGSAALITLGVATLLFSRAAWEVEPDELLNVRPSHCVSWKCAPVMMGWAEGRHDYRPTFAFLPDGPHRLQLPVAIMMTPDASRVVWEAVESWDAESAGVMVLDQGVPEPRRTTLEFPFNDLSTPGAMALSGDGERLAVASQGLLQIYDLDEERLVETRRLPTEVRSMWFLDGDTLLVGRGVSGASRAITAGWEGWIVDLDSEKVIELGDVGSPVAHDEERRLVITAWGSTVRGISTLDGSTVFEVRGESAVVTSRGVLVEFSPDGRSEERAGMQLWEGGAWTALELPEGVTDIRLGYHEGDSVWLAMSSSGILSHHERFPDDTALYRLDLASGELSRVAEGLVPVTPPQAVGTVHYHFEYGPEGRRLVSLDPDTGEVTVLTGPDATVEERS